MSTSDPATAVAQGSSEETSSFCYKCKKRKAAEEFEKDGKILKACAQCRVSSSDI